MTEYYDILGIPKNSNAQDIKKAYRKKSLQWHPDKNNNSDESNKKFKEIGEAYGVLSNDEKRQIYDKFGKAGLENHGNGGGMNPNDIFSQFFGGGMGGGFSFNSNFSSHHHHHHESVRQKGPDKRVEIQISISDSMNGATKHCKLGRNMYCSTCRGTGLKKNAKVNTCDKCNGSGICTVIRQMGPMRIQQQGTCDKCRGEGKITNNADKCNCCNGGKIKRGDEVIEMIIKKGSKDGDSIVFKNKSDALADCEEEGDLHIIFRIDNTETMSRNGDDLIVKYPILLSDALSGLSFVFNHPNGNNIVIEYNEIISPNTKYILDNMGFLNNDTNKYGSMIFEFEIIFPKTIDSQRKQLLRKLLPKRKDQNKTNLSVYTLNKTDIDIKPPNINNEYDDELDSEKFQQCAQQ